MKTSIDGSAHTNGGFHGKGRVLEAVEFHIYRVKVRFLLHPKRRIKCAF